MRNRQKNICRVKNQWYGAKADILFISLFIIWATKEEKEAPRKGIPREKGTVVLRSKGVEKRKGIWQPLLKRKKNWIKENLSKGRIWKEWIGRIRPYMCVTAKDARVAIANWAVWQFYNTCFTISDTETHKGKP